jgi:hypothetical protein
MKKGLIGLAVIIGIIASGVSADHINNEGAISNANKAGIQIINRAVPRLHIAQHQRIASDSQDIKALIHDGLDPT